MDGAQQNLVSRRLLMNGMIATAAMAGVAPIVRAQPAPVAEDVEAAVIEELVTANRILGELEVVDAFGHISRRHPIRTDHFLMSRSRAPSLIEAKDIMEFDAQGKPVDAQGRSPYVERYIHAAIYAARPDVHSVVHDHSEGVIPFTVSDEPLRALSNAGGGLGAAVPVWDIRTKFGDQTNMLVMNMDIANDLVAKLGSGAAILMRGHGAVLAGPSIRVATSLANALERQARIQEKAMRMGNITYLSPGEIQRTARILDPSTPGDAIGRTWEYWCKKVDRPYVEKGY